MVTKQRLVILFLAAALILSLAYIPVTKYEEARQTEQTNIFQQGLQTGYQQAIIRIDAAGINLPASSALCRKYHT